MTVDENLLERLRFDMNAMNVLLLTNCHCVSHSLEAPTSAKAVE